MLIIILFSVTPVSYSTSPSASFPSLEQIVGFGHSGLKKVVVNLFCIELGTSESFVLPVSRPWNCYLANVRNKQWLFTDGLWQRGGDYDRLNE